MRRFVPFWISMIGAATILAGCGGGIHAPPVVPAVAMIPPATDSAAVVQLGAALATVERDSAADQSALDSLHEHSADSLAASRPPRTNVAVGGEDVRQEAERLFGAESNASFDIDVSSFAGNRRVLEYLEFFQLDARDRFEIWLSRLGRYEGMIRERLRARRLPEDLVYLTLIESGLSNTAVSRARAVGMWQFMSSTGRNYGLQIDPWVDERRDPFKATDAAANHLQDLVQRLGSVYLAAAAYNAGAGRIERAIRRLPGGGESDTVDDQTFFEIASHRNVRRETRDYVPKLIAAALIAKQPARDLRRSLRREGSDAVRDRAALQRDRHDAAARQSAPAGSRPARRPADHCAREWSRGPAWRLERSAGASRSHSPGFFTLRPDRQ